MKLGETLGAIATLQKKSPSGDNVSESAGEIARFAGENQRRIAFEAIFDARPM
jgi:hypothetical protein